MMKKMIIKVESLEDFWERNDERENECNHCEKVSESCVRSFEEPADLFSLFTPSRREVLAEVQRQPGSITDLVLRLQRGISEVEQDVATLAAADIVIIAHGSVQPVAEEVVFEAIPQAAALP